MSIDPEKQNPDGTWKKGVSGNPAGRPLKKRDKLDKLIEQFYGPECEQIVVNMMEVAQYDPDVDFNNTEPSRKRFWKPKYTNQQVVDCRKFLFEHYYGRPFQESHTEISTPEDTNIHIKFVHKKVMEKKDEH